MRAWEAGRAVFDTTPWLIQQKPFAFQTRVESTKHRRRKLFIQTGETRKCVREKEEASTANDAFVLDVSEKRGKKRL